MHARETLPPQCGHLPNAPETFATIKKANNSTERKKEKPDHGLKNSLAVLAQMVIRFARRNAKCVPLHFDWKSRCMQFARNPAVRDIVGIDCSSVVKLCEQFDENKMWNMRRYVINERENLAFRCLCAAETMWAQRVFGCLEKMEHSFGRCSTQFSMRERCRCESKALATLLLYAAAELRMEKESFFAPF